MVTWSMSLARRSGCPRRVVSGPAPARAVSPFPAILPHDREALPRTRTVLSPTTGWDSLTKAERRVTTLISQGHTNRSAASSLGVSANTVSTHLRAVFAKLGVQSRVQLANCLASYASQALPSRYDGRVQPTPDREGADVVVRAGPAGNGMLS
jgi:DNA-binding CsgD family transcriptional regulator